MHTVTARRHVLAKPHTPFANSGALVREMYAHRSTYVRTATDGRLEVSYNATRMYTQTHTSTDGYPLQSYMQRKHAWCFRVPVWCLRFAVPLANGLCAVVLHYVMRRTAYTVCTLAVCVRLCCFPSPLLRFVFLGLWFTCHVLVMAPWAVYLLRARCHFSSAHDG